MNDLEIRIVEGHNFATVDLFDPGHARKVLAEFGRAFGQLPASPPSAYPLPPGERATGFPLPPAERVRVGGELTPEQERFLEQAVAGLAQDGKVISVRLALF